MNAKAIIAENQTEILTDTIPYISLVQSSSIMYLELEYQHLKRNRNAYPKKPRVRHFLNLN